ncbi:MAG TPA: type VI secretion system tip protein TssI/VgrG [archaeon]|nr:type VI secretion system tip protein TssI/VgrG [archaeon]
MALLIEKKFSFISKAPGLDDETFAVVSFKGSVALSQPYEFDIMLVSENREIELENVLRQPARFTIHREEGGDVVFNGILARFEQLHEFGGYSFYRALLVSRLWWLTLTCHNQVLLNKSVPDFIDLVLKDGDLTTLDFEFRTQSEYPELDYVCQYGESHFNFISRWMEREGIYYYFEQTANGEKMIITDTRITHTSLPQEKELYYSPPSGLDTLRRGEIIQLFTCRQRTLPRKVLLKDYNYERPSLVITGTADVDDQGRGEAYIYGEHFLTEEEGSRLAGIRAGEFLCRKTEFYGESTIPFMTPGYTFNLRNHYRDSFNRGFLIVETNHEGSQTRYLVSGVRSGLSEAEEKLSYSNTFLAIPSDVQFRPPRKAKRPSISGTLHAKIDAEGSGAYAELDSQGRYKVRLPFDLNDEHLAGKASSLVRMMQPYGGGNFGMHFPLHKGTEVLLTFINGDPDRPVISGAVPNPETPSLINENNLALGGIRSSSGNQMALNDELGHKRIVIGTGGEKAAVVCREYEARLPDINVDLSSSFSFPEWPDVPKLSPFPVVSTTGSSSSPTWQDKKLNVPVPVIAVDEVINFATDVTSFAPNSISQVTNYNYCISTYSDIISSPVLHSLIQKLQSKKIGNLFAAQRLEGKKNSQDALELDEVVLNMIPRIFQTAFAQLTRLADQCEKEEGKVKAPEGMLKNLLQSIKRMTLKTVLGKGKEKIIGAKPAKDALAPALPGAAVALSLAETKLPLESLPLSLDDAVDMAEKKLGSKGIPISVGDVENMTKGKLEAKGIAFSVSDAVDMAKRKLQEKGIPLSPEEARGMVKKHLEEKGLPLSLNEAVNIVKGKLQEKGVPLSREEAVNLVKDKLQEKGIPLSLKDAIDMTKKKMQENGLPLTMEEAIGMAKKKLEERGIPLTQEDALNMAKAKLQEKGIPLTQEDALNLAKKKLQEKRVPLTREDALDVFKKKLAEKGVPLSQEEALNMVRRRMEEKGMPLSLDDAVNMAKKKLEEKGLLLSREEAIGMVTDKLREKGLPVSLEEAANMAKNKLQQSGIPLSREEAEEMVKAKLEEKGLPLTLEEAMGLAKKKMEEKGLPISQESAVDLVKKKLEEKGYPLCREDALAIVQKKLREKGIPLSREEAGEMVKTGLQEQGLPVSMEEAISMAKNKMQEKGLPLSREEAVEMVKGKLQEKGVNLSLNDALEMTRQRLQEKGLPLSQEEAVGMATDKLRELGVPLTPDDALDMAKRKLQEKGYPLSQEEAVDMAQRKLQDFGLPLSSDEALSMVKQKLQEKGLPLSQKDLIDLATNKLKEKGIPFSREDAVDMVKKKLGEKGIPVSPQEARAMVEARLKEKGLPLSLDDAANMVKTRLAEKGVPFSREEAENMAKRVLQEKGVPLSLDDAVNMSKKKLGEKGLPLSKEEAIAMAASKLREKGVPLSLDDATNMVKSKLAGKGVPLSREEAEEMVRRKLQEKGVPLSLDEAMDMAKKKLQEKGLPVSREEAVGMVKNKLQEMGFPLSREDAVDMVKKKLGEKGIPLSKEEAVEMAKAKLAGLGIPLSLTAAVALAKNKVEEKGVSLSPKETVDMAKTKLKEKGVAVSQDEAADMVQKKVEEKGIPLSKDESKEMAKKKAEDKAPPPKPEAAGEEVKETEYETEGQKPKAKAIGPNYGVSILASAPKSAGAGDSSAGLGGADEGSESLDLLSSIRMQQSANILLAAVNGALDIIGDEGVNIWTSKKFEMNSENTSLSAMKHLSQIGEKVEIRADKGTDREKKTVFTVISMEDNYLKSQVSKSDKMVASINMENPSSDKPTIGIACDNEIKLVVDKNTITLDKQDEKINVTAEKVMNITAKDNIAIKCGSSSITLKKDGTIELKGKKFVVDSSISADIKTKSMTVKATSTKIDSSTTTIKNMNKLG